MKVWLNFELVEMIRNWSVENIKNYSPRLCCEIKKLSVNETIKLVMQALQHWQINLLLIFTNQKIESKACVIDMSELANYLLEQINIEGTIAIIDLTMIGGCTFDFTKGDCEGEIEMLVASWGHRESTAKYIAENVYGAITFRGN